MSILEEFKDVPNYEGLYQVSNFGRVKSIKNGKQKIINPIKTKKSQYMFVRLYGKYPKGQYWLLHRLVATVWERPLLSTEDAHHRNKMKCCNCIWNVEIRDRSEHEREHNLGKIVSKESKQKNRLSHLGKKHSQESIEKMRIARKQYWQNKRFGGVN